MRAKRKMRHGATLVELLVVVCIICLLLAITLPAILKIRAAADSLMCKAQMREIGHALYLYHNDYRRLPAGCSYQGGKHSMPFASWCTRILPYIEREDLWEEARQAYRNSRSFFRIPPHAVATTVVPQFLCPSVAGADEKTANIWQAVTCYLGVEGVDQDKREGVLFLDSTIRFFDVRDGTSNTLMVGERPPSADRVLGWWYAGWGQNKTGSGDMVLSVRERNTDLYMPDCPPGPYHFQPGRLDDQAAAGHFWSMHPGGAHLEHASGRRAFLVR